MRPHTSVPHVLAAYPVFVCLCVALGAVSPSRASAQPLVAPDLKEEYAYSVGIKRYACVDPSDAMAHRWFQDEPCRLPMYHLPRTGVPSVDEPPRRQTYPRRSPGTDGGHAMFWRFPVQPLGPYEVPRHSWR